jgi:thiol-disulfide isomerase/thioredoxin
MIFALASSAFAAVNVGDKPQFNFKATDGTAITSESVKGKLDLLDFWATWCGPCVREAPHMIELNNKYGPTGLQVVCISLDQDAAALGNGIKQLKLNWPHHQDADGKVSGQFGVDSIPRVVLISPGGEVPKGTKRRSMLRDFVVLLFCLRSSAAPRLPTVLGRCKRISSRIWHW